MKGPEKLESNESQNDKERSEVLAESKKSRFVLADQVAQNLLDDFDEPEDMELV